MSFASRDDEARKRGRDVLRPFQTALIRGQHNDYLPPNDGRTIATGARWPRARTDQTIPIPGRRTVAQVEENCGAMQHGPLTAGQMAAIDALLEREPIR